MRLTPTFSKDQVRVYSSLFCAVLFISPAAGAFQVRHEKASQHWDVKFEEGTQEIERATGAQLIVGKKQITCRSHTRRETQLVVIPAARVTQLGYYNEYRSLASLAYGDSLDAYVRRVIERTHDLRAIPIAMTWYGFWSLFDHQRRFVRIDWQSKNGDESFVVLRVHGSDLPSILERLESSTGLRSVDLWVEWAKQIEDYWKHNPVARDEFQIAADRPLWNSIDAMLKANPVASPAQLARPSDLGSSGLELIRSGRCAVLAPDSDEYRDHCSTVQGQIAVALPAPPDR